MNKMLRFLSTGLRPNVLRAASAALLVVALAGPWAVTSDGVPPPEWCDERFILVPATASRPEFCAALTAGTEILSVYGSYMIFIAGALLSGRLGQPMYWTEWLIFPIFLTLLLPFTVPFVHLAGIGGRGARIYGAVIWGLALFVPLLLVLNDPILPASYFWGRWLFVATALAMLALELFSLWRERPRSTTLAWQ
jgi:hypothetical protein